MQKSLHEHFLSGSHQSFEKDVSICLINKTDPFETDPLKTIAHFGLNTKETFWAVHTIMYFTSVLPVYYCVKYVNLNVVSLLCCYVFTFLHYVTCNVRGIDSIRNWIIKGIQQFSVS